MDALLAPLLPLLSSARLALEPLGLEIDKLEALIFTHTDPAGTTRLLTEGWWLADLRSAVYIAIAYLLLVLAGSLLWRLPFVPRVDPYPLKFAYNLSQMMLCAYMTIEAGRIAYVNGYTLFPCNKFDAEEPPVLNVLYLFYLSKLWDFWDTFFMVIGKKWAQISFLHVYHHSSIWLFYWLNSRVNYDGDIYLTICLNGFIHTVMYTYYFVCMHTKVPSKWLNQETKAKFPRGASVPIWWKSALTMNQMLQFCVMITQAGFLLYNECAMPNKVITQVYMGYIFTMLFLFGQFFVSSYMSPQKKGKKGKKD